jgi:co-chaperonin GroES (HSP10)
VKVRCIGNAVLVRPDPKEERVGRIFIPQSAQKRGDAATVVSMGPGILTKKGERWPMPDVQVGSRVFVHPGGLASGPTLEIDGVKHVFVRSDDLLAESAVL